MPVQKIWKIKEREISDELLKFCDNNKILAKLLVNRDITTPEKAEKFLNPLKCSLSSPYIFTDMKKTTLRIRDAVENKENITIYGDFDADGVTSTALLYLTLRQIGAKVDYYLPNRSAESHGMNTKALVKIISKRKSKLIITVDCGIANIAEVNFAKSLGCDIIITDHHEAGEELPEAYSILNPKAQGAISETADAATTESLSYLAGAGVAFKLACALLEEYKCENFVNEIIPTAAIGTIGDIVELKGENRTLTVMGLELIKQGKQEGIQTLLSESGIKDIKSITSETIAFQIVPKINAAGRLESAETALKVLITEDEQERETNVKLLSDLNSLRQKLCDETYEEARMMFEQEPQKNKKAVILLNDNWHLGVTGIVCSKLVEEYNKPSFLMTRDPQNEHIIRCSCRSVAGLNIYEVLSELKDLFEGFGGHKSAAGFSFDDTKITFNAFKTKLLNKITEHSTGLDLTKTVYYADCELSPEDINLTTFELQEKLQPFGAANPVPVYIINDANVASSRMMGQNSEHLKLFVNKQGSKNLECIKWSCPGINIPDNSKLDLLFTLRTNTFNNITNTQLLISDMHSKFIKNRNNREVKILDHRRKKNIFIQVSDFLQTTKKKTGIFVKNPELKKKLSENETENVFLFSDCIPENIEQLMFFDVPDSKSSFENIIKITTPQIIHLMNFEREEISVDTLITKTAGMLKYALTNLNGNADIARMSDALGVSKEATEFVLELFESENTVEFEHSDEHTFIIKKLNPSELSKLKQNEITKELKTILEKESEFKKEWFNSDIEEFRSSVRLLN